MVLSDKNLLRKRDGVIQDRMSSGGGQQENGSLDFPGGSII